PHKARRYNHCLFFGGNECDLPVRYRLSRLRFEANSRLLLPAYFLFWCIRSVASARVRPNPCEQTTHASRPECDKLAGKVQRVFCSCDLPSVAKISCGLPPSVPRTPCWWELLRGVDSGAAIPS